METTPANVCSVSYPPLMNLGIDFVERFFKLTLDNVYRFVCSLLFAVALLAWVRTADAQRSSQIAIGQGAQSAFVSVSPVDQLKGLLNWLAIPSTWLSAVGGWLSQRETVVACIAFLVLLVALVFAAAGGRGSRSGSTALLSIVVLAQVGQGATLLSMVAVFLVGLLVATGASYFLSRKKHERAPTWTSMAWATGGQILTETLLAAAYLFSPLGWLISQDRHNVRGTLGSPIYIEQADRRGPTGAIR